MSLITPIARWGRANWPLLTNAGSFIGTTFVNSGLGFVFWWVAARLFPAAAVGAASATVAAMTLLGSVSTFGLSTLIINRIRTAGDKRSEVIATALAVTIAAGLLTGFAFAWVAGALSSELGVVLGGPMRAALFASGVALTGAVLVFDQALLGLLRGGLMFCRNAIFSGGKLALLVMLGLTFSYRDAAVIFIAWVVGILLSLGVPLAITVPRLKKLRLTPRWGIVRDLTRPAMAHYSVNMALLTPGLALPLSVTILLSAELNARFYVGWMIASFAFVVPYALATALFSVGASQPNILAQRLRLTLWLSFIIGLATNAGFLLFGSMILRLFGNEYASESTWMLQVLSLGVFAITIKDHYVTIYRIQNQVGRIVGVVAVGSIMELGLPVLGALVAGLPGVIVGWLLGLYIQAILMMPAIIRVAKRGLTGEEEHQRGIRIW